MKFHQVSVLTCLASLFLGVPVVAQPAEVANDEHAIELGHDALARYHKGEWQAAHDEFVEADHFRHSAVFRLYAARTERNLGHLLEAATIYESVAAEKFLDGPPEAASIWETAAADAVTELEDVRQRTPSAQISVTGEAAEYTSLRIDGTLWPSALPATVQLDPGLHRFQAVANGRHVTRELELMDGQKLVPVELLFEAPADTSTPVSRKSTEQRTTRQRRSEAIPRSHSLGLPPLIAFVIGASGLVVGAIAGTLVYADSQDIKKNCDGTHCLASDQAEAGSARGLGRIATAGFVIGGFGLATGVAFVFIKGPSASRPGSSTPGPIIAFSLSVDLHDF